ncbi:Z1 domain-containing protein [Bdellovibrio sp. HCB274]|uniref:Z1 domain-containing protein n=1 Tax=Bdellovibrio sp. HCB274 TaxID=3394361 RepID=UPI0039B5A5E2
MKNESDFKMEDIFQLAIVLINVLKRNEIDIDMSTIERETDKAIQLTGSIVSGELRQKVLSEIQKHFEVITMTGRSIDGNKKHAPWLTTEKKQAINWIYWNNYSSSAIKDLPPSVRQTIDRDTEKILSKLENPNRQGPWSTKGLIMGSVQAGKTANYIGLITKAADAGYKVVIVLTGMHESLRVQTQVRINQGFVGAQNYVANNRIGFYPDHESIKLPKDHPKPICMTAASDDGDFNIRRADQSLQHLLGDQKPVVFVVKKNVSILKNLYNWMSAEADRFDESQRKVLMDVPALIIDDEADQASVDTGVSRDGEDQEGDPKKTNALIRGILNLFEKSAYVAVTATPFANVMIHNEIEGGLFRIFTSKEQSDYNKLTTDIETLENNGASHYQIAQLKRKRSSCGTEVFLGEDLFPKDFVYSLNPPSNYFGAEQFFGISDTEEDVNRASLPIIKVIDDHVSSDPSIPSFLPSKRDTNHVPEFLPGSLKNAINSFLISSAIRNLRDKDKLKRVNSMLVHVTRYNDPQKEVYALVSEYVEEVRNGVIGSGDRMDSSLVSELKKIYEGSQSDSTDHSYDKISQLVHEAGIDRFTPENFDFDTILMEVRKMFGTSGAFETVMMNGLSRDAQIFQNKDYYSSIVIGGDKLSRGLTLDGLLISYYLRSSDMYDTLMQMGRWFGYRSGYIDLIRVFTTAGLRDRFRHLALATKKLREEFEDLSYNPHSTPNDFGLKILSHPDMTVTSPMKLKNAFEYPVTFAGSSKETIIFLKKNREKNNLTVRNFGNLLSQKHGVRDVESKVFFENVNWGDISNFIKGYQFSARDNNQMANAISEYIGDMAVKHSELTQWSVGFLSVTNELEDKERKEKIPLEGWANEFGGLMYPSVRRYLSNSDGKITIKRIGSPEDEKIGLSTDELDEAADLTEKWRKENNELGKVDSNKKKSKYTPKFLRLVRSPKKGLLLFYPTIFKDDQGRLLNELHWGVLLSFPFSKNAEKKIFVVNAVFNNETVGDDDEQE